MRRTDRLFQIIQALRRHKVVTAHRLATELEVSDRTIYRDVDDLVRSGVPIDGEAGVGYRLLGYDLPPLMFTEGELEALVLGVRIVESWTDPELAKSAAGVLDKVEAVLPMDKRASLRDTPLFAPKGHAQAPLQIDAAKLRKAVTDAKKVRINYADAHGKTSSRVIRPLALAFYGPVWLLIAWCELRNDFRTFRLDRIADLEVIEELIEDEPGKTLDAFVQRMAQDNEGKRPTE